MNYEDDIRIDEEALDIEWLEQASLMMKYARNAADARRELDRAKENFDIVKAEVDKDIRTNPDDYEVTKVTDASVAAAILGTEEYKEASQRLIQAKYEADIASSAVRAVEQRKDALENLVRLHGQQYFAGPRVPHDLAVLREQKQKRANTIVGSAMRRAK